MLLAENIKLPTSWTTIFNHQRSGPKIYKQLLESNLPNSAKLKLSWANPWVGPYRVRSVEGLNVELELPPTWQIHPVFHQSLSKPYFGDYRVRSVEGLLMIVGLSLR